VSGVLTFVREGRNEPGERRACREGEKCKFLAMGAGMDV
jgi:hypothetical protein